MVRDAGDGRGVRGGQGRWGWGVGVLCRWEGEGVSESGW